MQRSAPDIAIAIAIVEIAPARPTQNFRRGVTRRINALSLEDNRRLNTAFVAVGGHEAETCAFIYYHRIRRIIGGPNGLTYSSEFAFIRRIPLDNSPFPWIIWERPSDLQLPSPPSSPLHRSFRNSPLVAGPCSRQTPATHPEHFPPEF